LKKLDARKLSDAALLEILTLTGDLAENYSGEDIVIEMFHDEAGPLTVQQSGLESLKIGKELGKSDNATLKTRMQLAAMNNQLQISDVEIDRMKELLKESKANFRQLVEQAPVAIMVLIGEHMIIEVANQPMLDILHQDTRILGKPILQSMQELRGEPAVQLIFDVFRTGNGSDGAEVPVRMMHNGQSEIRYFNFSYRPLLEDGKIIGVMDLAVEVTDQVHVRQSLEAIIIEKTELAKSLRSSEQRLQGILDTMAEGVGIIDASGKMVYANPMAQRILGLDEQEIKKRTFGDKSWQNLRLDGSLLPDEEHPMAIMMQTAQPVYDQEIGVQPPDADRMYISINAAPIFDDAGKLSGGIGTFMDVTNRRKMMMQKEDFISVASHELKTPVTTLKATLQLLTKIQDMGKPELLKTMISQANKSMGKLNKLISELLDTNRISQGHLQIHKTNFNIGELIHECSQHIRGTDRHEVIIKGDLGLEINADEQQLEQVLLNFISNAAKYAPASDEIVIEVIKQDHAARISITDKGPGISPEKIPYVFDRYYRVNHDSIQVSGLGLGLFICAEIIKKHGGEIGVNSQLGQGSTFWFTVPI
jgi:PAS domain S-box-containing protein